MGRSGRCIVYLSTVDAGAVVCLLGANGAGKTTTLNCISGVVPVQEGRLFFGNEEITRLQPEDVVRGVSSRCRKVAKYSPSSRSSTICGGKLVAVAGSGTRCAARPRLRLFPAPERGRRDQFAGHALRWRAADADDRRALMARPEGDYARRTQLGLVAASGSEPLCHSRRHEPGWVDHPACRANARLALRSSSYGYILENGEIRLHGASRDLRDNRGGNCRLPRRVRPIMSIAEATLGSPQESNHARQQGG